MMYITITEFSKKLSHFIKLCEKEDFSITKNGEVVAILSNPNKDYYQTLDRLFGCLKEKDTGENYKEIIGQEIMKRCGY